jgi:hypothetical protein
LGVLFGNEATVFVEGLYVERFVRILVCSENGMLLYKCAHMDSCISVSAVREFKYIFRVFLYNFTHYNKKYLKCYKVEQNDKI